MDTEYTRYLFICLALGLVIVWVVLIHRRDDKKHIISLIDRVRLGSSRQKEAAMQILIYLHNQKSIVE
ncbi:MAG: hypothetical protein MUD00_02680 [Candidatus Pacebacteria bacterium]|jgi:hypothetical protein|nr:hypothetical protein [Candidatus Paceibacterota bacterium]